MNQTIRLATTRVQSDNPSAQQDCCRSELSVIGDLHWKLSLGASEASQLSSTRNPLHFKAQQME